MTHRSENLCPDCGEVLAGWDLDGMMTHRLCLECNPSGINARAPWVPRTGYDLPAGHPWHPDRIKELKELERAADEKSDREYIIFWDKLWGIEKGGAT